jgi:catechol-2,3-dioxygenase
MADFAGLREMHRRLEEEGVRELSPASHGNALSVYFKDPEGNRIELFVDTPWYVEQPVRVPLDMSLSDAEIWAWAERDAHSRAGFMPVEEWRAGLRAKLARSR